MDRRLYQREYINIESEFINETSMRPEQREFFGQIADISEGGVKITISEKSDFESAKELSVGDKIYFQAVDTYKLFGQEHTELVLGEAIILRVEESDDVISFGCKFEKISDELLQYIQNRKVASFMNAGCSMFYSDMQN